MKVAALAAVAAYMLAAAPTAAQDAAPGEPEARARFSEGREAFADGRYAEALAKFEEAYELSPRPQLLFNIGAAADRLRRDERALRAYREYLAAEPDAMNRAEVEARIEILERTIAEDRSRAEDRDSTTVVQTSGGRVVTWVFAGMTVALAGLATASWLIGDGEFDELRQTCIDEGGCTEQQIDESPVALWDALTNVSIGLSAACAAAAVVFFVLEAPDDDPPDVMVGVGPGAVTAAGRF